MKLCFHGKSSLKNVMVESISAICHMKEVKTSQTSPTVNMQDFLQ